MAATSSNEIDDHSKYSCTRVEETWLSLTVKNINIKAGEWYNLATSRRVKKMANRTYLIYPRIAGNVEQIAAFLQINNISMKKIIIPKQLNSLRDELNSYTEKLTPQNLAVNSIDDIEMEKLEHMQAFSFIHRRAAGKMVNVVDGDTFDCAFLFSPDDWSIPIMVRNNNKMCQGQNFVVCRQADKCNSQILLKLRIRLFGIDAADDAASNAPDNIRQMMHEKKEAATQFVLNWQKRYAGRIWLEFMGTGARGRTLAKIYGRTKQNGQSKKDLTTALLTYRDKKCGQVAVCYDGGNKQQAWTDL